MLSHKMTHPNSSCQFQEMAESGLELALAQMGSELELVLAQLEWALELALASQTHHNFVVPVLVPVLELGPENLRNICGSKQNHHRQSFCNQMPPSHKCR